jgi:hypothetical protein
VALGVFHESLGDVAKLAVAVLRQSDEHAESVVGGAVMLGDEDAFGLVDDRP